MATSTVQEIAPNTETPLSSPLQPGVDHSQHVEPTRLSVAKSVGVNVSEVTPLVEVAENGLHSFLEGVVHTQTDQESVAKNDEGSSRLEDIQEELGAVIPGERPSTVRLVSSKVGNELESKRNEKMDYQEEKAA